jgi:hypothetical protein
METETVQRERGDLGEREQGARERVRGEEGGGGVWPSGSSGLGQLRLCEKRKRKRGDENEGITVARSSRVFFLKFI